MVIHLPHVPLLRALTGFFTYTVVLKAFGHLKGAFTQKLKFCHYLLALILKPVRLYFASMKHKNKLLKKINKIRLKNLFARFAKRL